jgi:putative oxidoreductase
MTKLVPTRLAEIGYGLTMAAFAVLHLKYGGGVKDSVPSYFPGEDSTWMYVTGACFGLAAIAIILNKFKTLACYLLAAMLIVFILTIHLPFSLKGGNHYQLLKDAALAMGAIIIGNNTSKK